MTSGFPWSKPLRSNRSISNAINGRPWNPKLTLKVNGLCNSNLVAFASAPLRKQDIASPTRLWEIFFDERHIPFQIENKNWWYSKLLPENLISQLMNFSDYFADLWIIMFISSCFEMREKLIWPLLEYWINVVIYINVEIVP